MSYKTFVFAALAIFNSLTFDVVAQGWVAEVTINLNHGDYAQESVTSGTVTYSGQVVHLNEQIVPFMVVFTGAGVPNGNLSISVVGKGNVPYDEGDPDNYPLAGTYNGNHSNFNCSSVNFSNNTMQNEFNGYVTLYPQTTVSAPNYSATCESFVSTFNASSCSSLEWQISAANTGPFQVIPGQTGSSLGLTRAMVASMGFANSIGTFYVRAKGRDLTVSDVRPVTLYYPSPQFSANAISPNCSNGTGTIQVAITSPTPLINDFIVSLYDYAQGPGPSVNVIGTSHSFTGLAAGQYHVQVKNNTNTTTMGDCGTPITLVNNAVVIPPAILVSLTPYNVTCNGYNNGSVQASIQNAVNPIQTYTWIGGGAGNNPRTNCAPGNYSLTVTDNKGCTGSSGMVAITQPAALTVDATSPTPEGYNGYNVKCAGQSNGSMSALAAGGTDSKSYYWSTGQSGAEVGGIGAGSYTVTATDQNGCTAYDNVTLSAPPPIDFTLEATPITCPGASTGSLTAQGIINAFGLVTYSWSTGETAPSINNKPQGIYSVTITDGGGSGCSATRQQSLVEPQPFTVEVAPTSSYHGSFISCDGAADGVLNATVRNTTGAVVGASNYQWYRNNISYDGGPTVSILSSVDAATYRVEATYGSGCTTQATYVLNDPPPVTAEISPTSDHNGSAISCPGASDGSLLATGQGGTPGNYTFQWEDGPPSANISGIGAGTYFVSVTDINGCNGIAQYELTDPLAIIPSITITSDYHGQGISCTNATDGILTASSLNGAAPIAFTWSNGATGVVANSLSAGAYSVVATDANGCSVQSQPVELVNPIPVQASIAILSDYHGQAIRCHDEGNAILRASGQGGTNVYSYIWSTAATTSELNGLYHGSYSVTVTDQNTCSDSEIIVLENPSDVVATIKSHSDFNGFGVQCHGNENGFIEVEASGGTNEFTYAWPSLGETTPLVEHLPSGTYAVTVTDSNGCTEELSFEVTEPEALGVQLLNAIDVACFGESTGSITASPTGGVGEKDYTLDGLTWQSDPQFTSLLADQEYQITVRDANQCTDSFSKTLQQPDQINIEFSVMPSLCGQAVGQVSALVSGGAGDFLMTWRDFENNIIGHESIITDRDAGIYTLQVFDANNCELTMPAGIASLDGPVLEITETNPVSCYSSGDGKATVAVTSGNGPYSIAWDDNGEGWARNNLLAGTHYASVTDVNGCVAVIPVAIENKDRVVLSISEKQDPSCFQACDGKITLNATGGNGGFQFTWNEQASNNVITGLCAGNQIVRVIDRLGCGDARAVTLYSPEQVRLRAVSRKLPRCHDSCDGEIEVAASGGDGKYAYAWGAGSTDAIQKNLCPGSYEVSVKDGKNCIASQQFAIGNATKVEANLIKLQSPVCYGDCNGIVEVQAFGGAGNYKYSWSDGTSQSNNSALCAGVHQVDITDQNSCKITQRYTVPGVPELKVDLGGGIVLCEGQQHVLNVGSSWKEIVWRQSAQIVSTAPSIIITEPGEYSVEVSDARNCKATDEFLLENSNNLLEASFIMAEKASMGDTVVIIDISWPLPETVAWTLPEKMQRINQSDDVIHGKFSDPGRYDVKLDATLGQCRDQVSKSITILDDKNSPDGGRLGAEEFLKTLTLHPNPNTGAFEVEVEFIRESPIDIRIWSIVNSRLVAEVHDEGSNAYKKSFSLSPISSGTYVLKVEYEGGFRALRFLIH